MNVYDFDGTIYHPDCAISFALWCMNRHPSLWFTFFPGLMMSLLRYKMGRIPNYQLQRKMFSYLTMSRLYSSNALNFKMINSVP